MCEQMCTARVWYFLQAMWLEQGTSQTGGMELSLRGCVGLPQSWASVAGACRIQLCYMNSHPDYNIGHLSGTVKSLSISSEDKRTRQIPWSKKLPAKVVIAKAVRNLPAGCSGQAMDNVDIACQPATGGKRTVLVKPTAGRLELHIRLLHSTPVCSSLAGFLLQSCYMGLLLAMMLGLHHL